MLALGLAMAFMTACDPTPVVLRGTVGTAGTPAGGVVVGVYSNDSELLVAETVTNAAGGYAFHESVLAQGTYRVRIGDLWWPDGDDWSDATAVSATAASPAVVDHTVESIATLSGTVVDSDGSPVDAALVGAIRVSDGQAVTGELTGPDGTFELHITQAGPHHVLLLDTTGAQTLLFVGAPPTIYDVQSGDVVVGAVDVSTGLLHGPSAQTARASVTTDGTEANGSVGSKASISADGRYVAFSSSSSNLVAGDSNGTGDVFVHDSLTGTTTRVSISSDGAQANSSSGAPSISADGRYVAFESLASNLVAGHTNAWPDVFVHDRQTATTTLVSVASDGTPADQPAFKPDISDDGRFVTFTSYASNLAVGDGEFINDVFVHDRQTATTTVVSVASDGTAAVNNSDNPSISAGGRYVAFDSFAPNLVSGDTNVTSDVFVHDRQTGTTTRVSVASDGNQANDRAVLPSISADGRYVAFESPASNLVAGDTNSAYDVFVHDRQTGGTTRVSKASDGTQGSGSSWMPSISADGRYVTFVSAANDLVAGDTKGQDAFLHDLQTGVTTRISVAADGGEADGTSYTSFVASSGSHVAFTSDATNLVAGDTNGTVDVFIRAL